MSIEVEKKSIVIEDELNRVKKVLSDIGAEDLGENNTVSVFYIHDDYQLKLQIRTSKGDAKIAWKSGGFNGASAREEIELPFSINDAEQAKQLLDRLQTNFKQVKTIQKRHDYKIDGVEVALKWSQNWGFHIELDMDVESESDTTKAPLSLRSLRLNLI